MFFLNFELLSCFKLSTKISRKMTHSIKALYGKLNVRLSCDKRKLIHFDHGHDRFRATYFLA